MDLLESAANLDVSTRDKLIEERKSHRKYITSQHARALNSKLKKKKLDVEKVKETLEKMKVIKKRLLCHWIVTDEEDSKLKRELEDEIRYAKEVAKILKVAANLEANKNLISPTASPVKKPKVIKKKKKKGISKSTSKVSVIKNVTVHIQQ